MIKNNAVGALAWLALSGAITAISLYPWLPEMLPVHWGIDGKPDGWGHKSWAAFVGPLGISALLIGTQIRPMQRVFPEIFLALGLLFTHFHYMSLLGGMHPEWDLSRPLVAGLLLCFAWMGNVLGKVRPNRWVGIRTPWTFADEGIWIRTHRRAARLMVGAGVGGALLMLSGVPPVWAFVLILIASLEPVVYSYRLFRERTK